MKVKFLVVILMLGLFLAVSGDIWAQRGMMFDEDTEAAGDHENLEQVLSYLVDKYKVDTADELECDRLSDEDLIRLGDGVMEEIHPGERHEEMDEMMGGEGSESLDAVHLQMGRNYLGCDADNPAVVWGGTIGGMMGRMWPMALNWQEWNKSNTINNDVPKFLGKAVPWIGLAVAVVMLGKLLVFILVVILLVAAIRYLWSGGGKGKRRGKAK